MRTITGEGPVEWDRGDSGAQEEKIFVAVRLRPLNAKELVKNNVSNWECINDTSIVFKNAHQDRSLASTTYTFDRVFGGDFSTRQVYEKSAKRIALSVLSGINSTIFAYGQTSSGKTYTMSGITEYAVADTFDYINKHPERNFVLKFSALEIYNETVKDLLCPDGSSLRLIDYPERGTIVDKLTEVTLTNVDNLYELLSYCESQRQTGETRLNEHSSRSHQILRLTIESEVRQYFGVERSTTLSATVNFVDLAGSERASQTLSRGRRLKEGSHINRSLLTLGTVIRKLSQGRNGHIPYRDSKLTRILQNSLGGNARTAIICTLSPAHTQVEQSKNTLVFASCAKQVSTNARVNVSISDKMLVKQLQSELTKLENELRNLRSLSAGTVSASVLKEKELLIAKMENEMKEIAYQRDFALSRVESMLRSGSSSEESKYSDDMGYLKKDIDEHLVSEASEIYDPCRSDIEPSTIHLSSEFDGFISSKIGDQSPENNEEQFFSDNMSPTQYIDKYFGPDPCKVWEKLAEETSKKSEDYCKDVQCIEMDLTYKDLVSSMPPIQNEDHISDSIPYSPDNDSPTALVSVSRSNSCAEIHPTITKSTSYEVPKDNENTLTDVDSTHCSPHNENTLMDVDSTTCSPDNDSSTTHVSVSRSNSCADILRTITKSTSFEVPKDDENALNEADNQAQLSMVEAVPDAENECRKDFTHAIKINCMEEEEEEEQNLVPLTNDCVTNQEEACVKEVTPESVKLIESYVGMEKERTTSKPEPEESADIGPNDTQAEKPFVVDWLTDYERKINEIIHLWDACHIPLVHRSYFLLLFEGDPSDAVYIEVELRRLSFLKNSKNGAPKDDPTFAPTSSAKALNRERGMLSKRMLKKYSSKERDELYKEWGINIKSKQRRVQLCQKLWTDTTNMENTRKSAAIVARLMGFKEPRQVSKEMFGLRFLPSPESFSWRKILLP